MKKFLIILSLLIVATTTMAQDKNIEKKVDELLLKMTLREKVGQLNQYSGDQELTGPASAATNKRAAIEAGELGSMLNIHGAADTRKIQEFAMNSRLKIPLIFAQDVIHGYRITFPIPLAEAASWDLQAIEKAARIAGAETAAAGVHWTFAPMVDVSRDPRWGRVMEGAGEDTYLGTLIGVARVRGFQGKGIGELDAVIACTKHFAAYGAAQAGRDYSTTDISERVLWETYFPPFKATVDAGVGSFMTSFNDINGVPSTGNKWLFTDILRDKWGFSGMVVSDWGAVGELIAHGFAANPREAAIKAMNAGVDMDMESRAYINNMEKLINDGVISQQAVDQAVRRILYKKYELGLFDDPFRFSNEDREKAVLNDPEHRKFAKEIAEKSIVLLKQDESVLPLTDRYKNVAVIGPLAKSNIDMKGNWAISRWDPAELVSPYEGIAARVPKGTNLLYAKGCEVNGTDKSGFAEAIEMAKKADVIIMTIGESWSMSGEAKSRADISIPGVQEDLIKEIQALGKPVVVLLMAGRPMTFSWTAENVGSIFYTWWLGSEAGNAMASVLYGDYNPSGKLPMTFPRSVGQIPVFYNMKNTGRPVRDPSKISFGSAYIDIQNSPQYAFGHGLSYTTFDYSDLSLSKDKIKAGETITVKCKVGNSGKYDGAEVVQMYLRDRVGSITRPIKELKGFDKIFIKAGETRDVEFTIDPETLSFYDIDMNWSVEPGVFDLMIGTASDKILLKSTFEVIE